MIADERRQKTEGAHGGIQVKIGLEVLRGVKTMSEIAQAYGVHPVVVGQWKKENRWYWKR